MLTTVSAPVVVGVNGSAVSLAAVRTAAREAAARGRALRVLHAFVWPYELSGDDRSAGATAYPMLRQQAGETLHRAVLAARAAEPTVTVHGRLVDESPTTALLRESRTAALLVIGEDGPAGRLGLPVDAVVVQVVARARCAVLVVCPQQRHSGEVVVGVDGSATAQLAVDWGFDEAARRGVPLVAAHAWEPDAQIGSAEAAQALLAEAVDPWRAKYPAVTVRLLPVRGEPAQELPRLAATAQLLVIGPRGSGGGLRTLLGTVSQAVLRRCAGATLVVHAAPGSGHYAAGPVPRQAPVPRQPAAPRPATPSPDPLR